MDKDILTAQIGQRLRYFQVGGQADLGRQSAYATPWLTERHGYDPTFVEICYNIFIK